MVLQSCGDGKVSILLVKFGSEHPRAWHRAARRGCGYGPVPLASTGCLCRADLIPSYREPSATGVEKPLPTFPAMRAGLTLPTKAGGFPGSNPPSPTPAPKK